MTEEKPESEIEAEPLDELKIKYRELIHEIDKLENKEGSLSQGLWTMAVSLFLFISLGLFNNPVLDLALLVAVLFFHELGHAAGMKLFDYKNIKMLFIPFLGAAVKGDRRHIASWKHCLVLLLGPLPGIALGIAFLAYFHTAHQSWAHLIAWYLIAVNAFNLLPFVPLDGGHFIRLLIFSRNPMIEALFVTLTAILICTLSYLGGLWILCGIGALILFSVPHSYKVNTLARDWQESIDPDLLGKSLLELDQDTLTRLVGDTAIQFPRFVTPKMKASVLTTTWERFHRHPPAFLATASLTILYTAAVFISIVVIALLNTYKLPIELHKEWNNRITTGINSMKGRSSGPAEKAFQEAADLRKPYDNNQLPYIKNLYHLAHAQLQIGELTKARANLKKVKSMIEARTPKAPFLDDVNQTLEALELKPYNRDTTLSIWEERYKK
jgi:Zn-dependent protease